MGGICGRTGRTGADRRGRSGRIWWTGTAGSGRRLLGRGMGFRGQTRRSVGRLAGGARVGLAGRWMAGFRDWNWG